MNAAAKQSVLFAALFLDGLVAWGLVLWCVSALPVWPPVLAMVILHFAGIVEKCISAWEEPPCPK